MKGHFFYLSETVKRESSTIIVWTVGVIVGSSEMGLSLDEYTSLPERDKQDLISKTADIFLKNGADFTIKTMEELPELIDHINLLIAEGKRPRTS